MEGGCAIIGLFPKIGHVFGFVVDDFKIDRNSEVVAFCRACEEDGHGK